MIPRRPPAPGPGSGPELTIGVVKSLRRLFLPDRNRFLDYDLVFTGWRLVAAGLGAEGRQAVSAEGRFIASALAPDTYEKERGRMAGLSPDQILAANPLSWWVPYGAVEGAVLDGGYPGVSPTHLEITSQGKAVTLVFLDCMLAKNEESIENAANLLRWAIGPRLRMENAVDHPAEKPWDPTY
jgi:hypothetical protein